MILPIWSYLPVRSFLRNTRSRPRECLVACIVLPYLIRRGVAPESCGEDLTGGSGSVWFRLGRHYELDFIAKPALFAAIHFDQGTEGAFGAVMSRLGFSVPLDERLVRSNLVESELREPALRVWLDHDLPTFKKQLGKFCIPGPCNGVPSGLQLCLQAAPGRIVRTHPFLCNLDGWRFDRLSGTCCRRHREALWPQENLHF